MDLAPEKKPSNAPEKASAKPVEIVAETDAKIESNARAEKTPKTSAKTDAKTERKSTLETSAKSTQKQKQKPTADPPQKNAVEQTVETPAKRKPETKPAAKESLAHDKGSVVDVMARPMPTGSPKSKTEKFGPRVADPSKGESQAKLDQEWIESLLSPKSKPKPKHGGDGEISDEMREKIELMVSYDIPSDVTGRK